MIGFLTHDLVESGYYEQAHRVVGTLLLIITSLNVVVGVRTSYLFGQEREAEVCWHFRWRPGCWPVRRILCRGFSAPAMSRWRR